MPTHRNPADLRERIEDYIVRAALEAGTATRYRRPLVGFASADDPAWQQLREIAEPTHLLPRELLPGAATVIAFFLPFAPEIVLANRRHPDVAPEWALAYRETNVLVGRIVEGLRAELAAGGVRAAGQPATHNWEDPVTLVSRWSHKSAAAVAGLGTFGLHRMLITEAGCAGRCGSLALDAALEPTRRDEVERCLHFRSSRCRACVEACPIGALREAPAGEDNLDRTRCYRRLMEVDAALGGDCCGRCAVGPCALGVPRGSRETASG